MATKTTEIRMPGTPKPWMNTVMRGLLRTPGLRRLLGGAFGVITVTGARTGNSYSTPVQPMEIDGEYVVLSQLHRTWWRNIRTHPEVELLVRGTTISAHATLAEGTEAHDRLTTCLERNPRVARFYGISSDPVDPATVDALLDRVVVIVIHPDT